MIKAYIKDQSYEIDESDDKLFLNGEQFDFSLEQLNDSRFHIIKNNKSYRAQIISFNKKDKTALIQVNTRKYQVDLKNKLDLLLERLGMEDVGSKGDNLVKAPMPGLIIDVKVEEGQEVKKGDPLLILEAMKMENVLKCPSDGVISAIDMQVGDSVEKGKVLIKL